MATLLALDVGTKTIGVARCDDAVGFVSPLCTLARKGVKTDSARVEELCRQHTAVAVVVGMPYELDGAEGRSARLARQVGEAVAERTGLPVHYQDERFSTVEATERLRAAGHDSRAQRAIIDQAAAAVILEDWLAARRAAQGTSNT
ncbi:MAG: Holliday junction resolvase RuvX [Alphaproteobacteria bacterium]|nr:Holliday junction resolvase RuvX [Alphaproteobacteria bacterium]